MSPCQQQTQEQQYPYSGDMNEIPDYDYHTRLHKWAKKLCFLETFAPDEKASTNSYTQPPNMPIPNILIMV